MTPKKGLPSDLLIAIGELTIRFSFLEAEIKHFIGIQITMSDIDLKIGKIVTSEMSFSASCRTLMSLYQHSELNKPLVKKIRTLLNKIERLEGKKTALIHSNWIVALLLVSPKSTSKSANGFTSDIKRQKLAEIKFLNQELYRATVALLKFENQWTSKNPTERMAELLETIDFPE